MGKITKRERDRCAEPTPAEAPSYHYRKSQFEKEPPTTTGIGIRGEAKASVKLDGETQEEPKLFGRVPSPDSYLVELLACLSPAEQLKADAQECGRRNCIPVSADDIRRFETGATRDTDNGKLDYEGFESPLVSQRFAQFMHRHRIQSDGSWRDSDNWQKGIPLDQYAKSLIRHVMEFWMAHDGYGIHPNSPRDPQNIEELLCAIRFNANGYLFELLKAKR